MVKAKPQFKKPKTPYAAKADGSSYAQLNGGAWDGVWLRLYPTPFVPKAQGVIHPARYMPHAVQQHMPLSVTMAGEVYERRSVAAPNVEDFRQVQYVLIRDDANLTTEHPAGTVGS
jgi:hypothetical protein